MRLESNLIANALRSHGLCLLLRLDQVERTPKESRDSPRKRRWMEQKLLRTEVTMWQCVSVQAAMFSGSVRERPVIA